MNLFPLTEGDLKEFPDRPDELLAGRVYRRSVGQIALLVTLDANVEIWWYGKSRPFAEGAKDRQ